MTRICIATVNRRELVVSIDDSGRLHSCVKRADVELVGMSVFTLITGDVIDISGSPWRVEEVDSDGMFYIVHEPTYTY